MLNGKIEYFFKIEDPMNLYHAELHIPSGPNMAFLTQILRQIIQLQNNVSWVFFLSFYVLSFYSTGMICCNMQKMKCDLWLVEKKRATSVISLKDPVY